MSLVAAIQKNSREEFRVSREDYNGHDLINVRVFYDAGDGLMRPGKQGVAFKAALLPDILQALLAANEVEAAHG